MQQILPPPQTHPSEPPSGRTSGRPSRALRGLLIAGAIALSVALTPLSAQARKPGVPGEQEVATGKFAEAARVLEAAQLKGADELYLLGRAYMGLGKKMDAYKAWTEALLIDKKNADKKRWTFLFPPKPLKGAEKQRLKDEFEEEYRELNAIVSRSKTLEVRATEDKAARADIDAKRADAQAEQLTKKADAKDKTIEDKQRMADRKAEFAAKTAQKLPPPRPVPPPHQGVPVKGGFPWGYVIIGLFVGVFLIAILFGRPSRETVVVQGGGGGPYYTGVGGHRVQRFNPGYNDAPFGMGPFYYQGQYFANQAMFYNMYGHHYTNRMYMDHFDQWGHGQAWHGGHQMGGRPQYDERMDQEIRHDMQEREHLYEQAADAGYEADMLRAKADDYRQDAVNMRHELSDADEALSAFDDRRGFSDDPGAGGYQGGYDDHRAYSSGGGFEDDPGAGEYGGEFADDPGAHGGFADDPGAGEYGGDFEDDPGAGGFDDDRRS